MAQVVLAQGKTWNNASSSWQDPQWPEWYSQEQQYQDVDDWWKNHQGGGKDDKDGES